MLVSVSFDFSNVEREAINYRYGLSGKADRETLNRFMYGLVYAAVEDAVSDWQQNPDIKQVDGLPDHLEYGGE
jgi:hypothetical protein